jgi:hypothetical protein
MIEHLAVLIETFPGAANQTWCFAHILNLVVKSILRQFEATKKEGKAEEPQVAAVVDEIDDEGSEGEFYEEDDGCGDGDVDDADDDEDGLAEEMDEMTVEEMSRLKESVQPIRQVLTKVSKFNKHQQL